MLPIHTILHPTDFSDRSDYAFHLACALARDYGARLVLLHVTTAPTVVYGEGILPPDPELLLQEAREQLNRLEVPDGNVRAERRLEEGDPVTDTLRVAQEIHADLIVMGTHGRTGLGRLLMGSVAEQVVRKASCPVLTVRTPLATALSPGVPVEEPLAVGAR
ncbi:MAG: universal stress protein [Gemmataceae bacterium]|nr:universal stress protein [Gemmataceae bacterium]